MPAASIQVAALYNLHTRSCDAVAAVHVLIAGNALLMVKFQPQYCRLPH